MRNWKIPFAILVLLILAMFFRWDVDRSISGTGNSVIVSKYKTDRWNGAIYNEVFTNASHNNFMIGGQMFSYGWDSSDSLTEIWGFSMVGCIAWLIYDISKLKGNQRYPINDVRKGSD